MTDYLSGAQTTATVPGIRVICRYLLTVGPASTEAIAAALRPPGDVEASRTILDASLSVASDLGLVRRPEGKGGEWLLEPNLLTEADVTSVDAFQGLVLRFVGLAALKALDEGRQPSDVALGLAWVVQRDPLDPLSYEFDGRTEDLMAQAGILKVIPQSTQWNAFRRWAIELGIAHRARSMAGVRLVVSTSEAIRTNTPTSMTKESASAFVDALLEAVPVLGHPKLVAALPEKARPRVEQRVSPAVAQGLISMAERGLLDLEPSEDAARSVPLTVGSDTGWNVRSVLYQARN